MSIELCVFRFGCFWVVVIYSMLFCMKVQYELFIGCVFRNMEIERSNTIVLYSFV